MMFDVRATSFLQEENIPASEMDHAKSRNIFHHKVLKSIQQYDFKPFAWVRWLNR
jgi:hypothetical protein